MSLEGVSRRNYLAAGTSDSWHKGMIRVDKLDLEIPPTAESPDLILFLRLARLLEGGLYEVDEAIGAIGSGIDSLRRLEMPSPPQRIEKQVDAQAPRFAAVVALVGCVLGLLIEYKLEWHKVDGPNILAFLLASVICAIVGAAAGAALGALFGSLIDGAEMRKANREAEQRYEKEVHAFNEMRQERKLSADKAIADYQHALDELKETRAVLVRIRDCLYASGPLYRSYQNIAAVCQLLEYFEAGRFKTLGEAYNQYELEIRLDRIITDMDVIIRKLDQVRRNQMLLYEVMVEVQSDLSSLNMTVSSCARSLDSIQAAQKATSIAASLAALSGFVLCGIERSQLKNMVSSQDIEGIRNQLEELNKRTS